MSHQVASEQSTNFLDSSTQTHLKCNYVTQPLVDFDILIFSDENNVLVLGTARLKHSLWLKPIKKKKSQKKASQ